MGHCQVSLRCWSCLLPVTGWLLVWAAAGELRAWTDPGRRNERMKRHCSDPGDLAAIDSQNVPGHP